MSAVLNIWVSIGGFAVALSIGLLYWSNHKHVVATWWFGASALMLVVASVIQVLPSAYQWDAEVAAERSTAEKEITKPVIQHAIDRAWLGMVALAIEPDAPEVGQPLAVRVTIKNTGRSPAVNVRGHIAFEGVKRGQAPNFDYTGLSTVELPIVQPEATHVASWVISRSASTDEIQPLSEALLNSLKAGQNVIFAHGRLDYFDAYGDPHWVEWCYSLSTTFGTWTSCSAHNGADTQQPPGK